MTDLERAALDYARAVLRHIDPPDGADVRPYDGTEAARTILAEAAKAHAAGMPDRVRPEATQERALACRPLQNRIVLRGFNADLVRECMEAAWEAGRSFGRGEVVRG